MDTPTAKDVLLLPIFFLFFGAFVYGEAFFRGFGRGVLPKYRWAGVILISLALLDGMRFVWRLWDPSTGPFYRAALVGGRVVQAHYVSLILPLIAGITVILMERWFRNYLDRVD